MKAPRRGIWGCPIKDVPVDIEAYRRDFRARPGRASFRGWGHFAAILLIGAGGVSLAAVMTRNILWWEWLVLPVGFLIANFVEWISHRYPMHNPTRGLLIMYEKHTLEHHRFYSEAAMEAESADDFDSVLFSLPALLFFLVGLGGPIAAAFYLLVSANAGWLFIALACANYSLYECFHMAYHLPEASWVGRLPGMARLRLHHTNHHDRQLMTDWNFNVTFPIFDALGGTHFERARRPGRGTLKDAPARSVGGFTLLELIIVVAIISVLTAIAIPKFGTVMRRSNEGACKGKLGSIRSALNIYYGDMEGQFPNNLASLTNSARYIKAIPRTMTPNYHPDSAAIVNGAAGAWTDAGGWQYNNATGGSMGLIWVNCTHTDSKDSVWTAY